MADEDKDLDQEFIDDVNAGYLLGKYASEFMELLVQSTGNSKVLDAMRQGKEIFDKETTDYLPDWLKKDQLRENKTSLDKPRERNNKDEWEKDL